MNIIVAALRFVIGAIAAAVLVAVAAFLVPVSFWPAVSFVVCVGALAVVFGDPFLLRLFGSFRWVQWLK